MDRNFRVCNRRAFLRLSAGLAAGVPLGLALGTEEVFQAHAQPAATPASSPVHRSDTKVAIVSCRSYGSEVMRAFQECFTMLGGLGGLVKNKTVTVKINLTGTDFSNLFNRPVGESYMTHSATAMALGTLLFAAGATRVRFVESSNSLEPLEKVLVDAGWDVRALQALGKVELENTRNLGKAKRYAHLKVPTSGYLFSSFDLNHAYEDTDVLVSLCKLKSHVTAGVTLSMKNIFGITPNSLYGDEATSEDAIKGRGILHGLSGSEQTGNSSLYRPPGLKKVNFAQDASYTIPRIVTDLCAARPIHLAIIDGITSMSGGEGPWVEENLPVKLTTPGVLIAGLNPVSTDAVGTAVMGFPNPRAQRGTPPFKLCDNHILMAEQAGLGLADLSQVEVLGMSIDKARYPYPDPMAAAQKTG